jgi:hypothetical protein
MSDMTRASLFHLIRHTPLRDAARELIVRVVKRTRLLRIEKAAVAEELLSHFLDACESGNSIDAAIAAFGDERLAAKLLWRAKIRNRPLAWHAMRWGGRAVLLLIAAYGLLALPFFLSRPAPKIDYLAELNRPIVSVPEPDRAWPIYRHALLDVMKRTGPGDDTERATSPAWMEFSMYGAHWPEVVAWLGVHQADVESIRKGAARPALGFVLGPEGSINDAELWPGMGVRARADWNDFPSLITTLLPHLNDMRAMATVLQADANLAQLDRDGARLKRDIDSMLSLGAQTRGSDQFLITELVALGIDGSALNAIERVLQTDPTALTDQQLIGLAHRISVPRTPADLFTLAGERLVFYDTVQRIYSDNGNGDGHLTAAGMRHLSFVQADTGSNEDNVHPQDVVAVAGGPVLMGAMPSRKQFVEKYDELFNNAQANLHLPARDANWEINRQFSAASKSSVALEMKYGLLAMFIPDWENTAATGEKYLGRRDGVMTAIALELYRRHHGGYPSQLNALAPAFMPEIPADRITGDPIKYKLVNGKPLLYSVGADRIDDGGKPIDPRNKLADPKAAAVWRTDPANAPRGDWILYPQNP